MLSKLFRRSVQFALVALVLTLTVDYIIPQKLVSKTAPSAALSTEFSNSAKLQSFKIRTTAYTHSESDHVTYGKATAAGTQLRTGVKYNSAAADWCRFPLGTVFKIKGEPTIYVIDDYGSALVGTSTINIYHTNVSSMNAWGVRHVEIEILKTGDIRQSRKILGSRKSWSHCNAMHSDMTRG